MGRIRTDDSDRFMAKYGTHDLGKEFDHSTPEPNRYLLKYSQQMNREHSLKALHHPNETFAGFTAVGSAHLKKSDLQTYLKTGPSEHVKDRIRERFKVESTPRDKLNWLEVIKADGYKYHPED